MMRQAAARQSALEAPQEEFEKPIEDMPPEVYPDGSSLSSPNPIIPPEFEDFDVPSSPASPPESDQEAIPQPPVPLTEGALRSDTLQDQGRLAVAMEQQRIMRVKRRRERRRRKAVGTIGGFFRTLFVVLISAGLVSTILTWFTDPQFLNPDVVRGLQENSPALIADVPTTPTIQPTLAVTPNWLQRIGIVAGHRGALYDPGAVCEDGWTEAEITIDVAQRIVRNLRALNYNVDLLDEFDPRLDNYQAAALLSIHANTCQDFGERVSGYLVAKAASRPDGGIDAIFAECIALKYEALIPLERRYTLTLDMTDYHTFREIHPLTPAAIIELGFMLADRKLMEEQPDLIAQALTNGIRCFLEPSDDYPDLSDIKTTPENFELITTPTIIP